MMNLAKSLENFVSRKLHARHVPVEARVDRLLLNNSDQELLQHRMTGEIRESPVGVHRGDLVDRTPHHVCAVKIFSERSRRVVHQITADCVEPRDLPRRFNLPVLSGRDIRPLPEIDSAGCRDAALQYSNDP